MQETGEFRADLRVCWQARLDAVESGCPGLDECLLPVAANSPQSAKGFQFEGVMGHGATYYYGCCVDFNYD